MQPASTTLRAIALLALFAASAHAQTTNPSALRVDPRAGVIELVPPAAIQQSPAAGELIERLLRKHVLLLQSEPLATQVLQNPEVKGDFRKQSNVLNGFVSAINARVIPGTNLIEVSIDPAYAGDSAVALTEALVDQHMQNEQAAAQNIQLERSVMLNNLKQRYQFRKDELSRDLREKIVRLSIDGMGIPGRLSAKEMELTNLVQEQFVATRLVDEAQTQLKQVKEETKDPAVIAKAQRGFDAAQQRLRAAQERIDATKQDLGDLTNAMNQYLTLKDDESATRAKLKEVNDELERITTSASTNSSQVRWLCHPSRG